MNKIIIIGAILAGLGWSAAITGSLISGEKLLPVATREDYAPADQFEQAAAAITAINITLENRRIEFYPTDDETILIDYYESEYDQIDVTVNGGTIIVENETRPYLLFGSFGFLFDTEILTVSVGLPAATSITIDADTANGEIDLASFTEIGALTLKTSNGAININAIEAPSCEVRTSNGAIVIRDVTLTERLNATTSNGRVELSDVTSPEIDAVTSNGHIDAADIVTQDMHLLTTNGDVDAAIIGSIDDYRVKMQTTNGSYYLNGTKVSVNAYNTNLSDIIDLTTANGNIRLSFSA